MYFWDVNDIFTFREKLMGWSETVDRPMPWRGEKDPYRIWLSEVILQQTRVQQGLPYYQSFITQFPTVHHLANAPEEAVFKTWEGLGYYSRARNLHSAAKVLSNQFEGVFPTSYAEVLALPGVGPYTAAAIASFAYDLPYAVLDGNVFRVLARYFGISDQTDSSIGKKRFQELAQLALDKSEPGRYNQAIMDFGALQCTPTPLCQQCPLAAGCTAFATGMVEKLPTKKPKPKHKKRYFHYLHILDKQGYTYLQKREEKDIWQGLHQFPLVETPHAINEEFELRPFLEEQHKALSLVEPATLKQVFAKEQTLSHQIIQARFWRLQVDAEYLAGYMRIMPENLSNFAFPKVIDWYFKENNLTLRLF